MVGRRPKPVALKLVTGNPGKYPINNAEPKPEGQVFKPAIVKGKAAKLWDYYAPKLEAQGILTAWDCDMFGTWCCLMAEFQKDPEKFLVGKIAQLRALAASFGLDPSSRARLVASGQQSAEDPAEKYFG